MTVSSSSRTPEILRQTDEQDAAEGEQDGGHRQAGKAPAAEAAKELPQLLAGDKARPQKAAGKEKGQLGYAQLFHKTTPLFNLSHYIIFLSP